MRLGEFYEARLRKAMSVMEAKDALGFKQSDQPTKEEIAKAYKNLAFKHHPDRGGDPAKMVELNVAKDVLEGKQRPSVPSGPTRTYQPQTHTTRERTPPPPDHRSFEEAMRADKVPTDGIEWKFKTAPQYGRMENGVNKGFVMVGKKQLGSSPYWVFVSVHYYSDQGNMFEPRDIDKWGFGVLQVPDYKGELAKVAPKKIREMWKGFGSRMPGYNAKVQIIPDGTTNFKKAVDSKGRTMSFKNALQAIGEDVPERWKGKIDITMELGPEIKGLGSPNAIILVVNGKEYKLSAQSAELAKKVGLYRLVFGDYYYSDSRKVITKMRGAKKKKILLYLKEICNKANETTPLIDALTAAHDKAK